jgi:phospholipase/carboxylesterase
MHFVFTCFPMIMRRLVRFATLCALLGAAPACSDGPNPPDQALIDAMTVTTLPRDPSQEAAKGTTALGLATPRDGFLYVPPSYAHTVRTPLVVLLHDGSSSSAEWESFKALSDIHGVVLLAIDSRFTTTWDGLIADFGPDVDFLEDALDFVFDRVNVDPARISIAGFVDGATWAIAIGVANAGLFTRVIGFSPGLLITPFARGFPTIMVSAGTADDVVTMPTTRDNVVEPLRNQGFGVEFLIVDAGHTISTDVRTRAFDIMKQQ